MRRSGRTSLRGRSQQTKRRRRGREAIDFSDRRAGEYLAVAPRGADRDPGGPVLGARTNLDAEVLAVDSDRGRPSIGQLIGADQSAKDINPVRDQLPLVRLGATLTRPRSRHPASLLPRDLSRCPIARSPRDRSQRLADLACREPILPSTGLLPPTLQPGRALNAIRVRPPLAGQDRREPMLGIAIGRATPPPLTTMRPLPIPTAPNHPRTHMLRDRTGWNLHRPSTLSLQSDLSTQIE